MKYYAKLETRQYGKKVIECSDIFDNQLKAEMWLSNRVGQCRELKIRVLDHTLHKQF